MFPEAKIAKSHQLIPSKGDLAVRFNYSAAQPPQQHLFYKKSDSQPDLVPLAGGQDRSPPLPAPKPLGTDRNAADFRAGTRRAKPISDPFLAWDRCPQSQDMARSSNP